mmetsp:Transcript_22254/g.51335  ORF Transcript_22254/g.51335 Transcript_22254/m.51335 type:complete len:279 (-) Transcript_22254:134-970(-)
MSPTLRVVPNKHLFVSEPDPRNFGNGPNEEEDSSWTESNWLKSRFHFSYAEYNSYENNNFGVLRVLNDDVIQPHRGFGTQPHRDMEILSYVVQGHLTHEDNLGNKQTLGRGAIQCMSTGSGIRHSEQNFGDVPLRCINIWIVPQESCLTPSYGSYECSDMQERKNHLQHLVSNGKKSTTTPLEVQQDCDIYAATLDLGSQVNMELPPDRQAYLLCIEGSIQINSGSATVTKYDACEITQGGGNLEFTAANVEDSESGPVAHFLLFVMEAADGSGRTDF